MATMVLSDICLWSRSECTRPYRKQTEWRTNYSVRIRLLSHNLVCMMHRLHKLSERKIRPNKQKHWLLTSAVTSKTSCLKKLCQIIFCSLSVKYELIPTKTWRIVLEQSLNKTVPKMPTSPKVCACTTLGNVSEVKCQTEPLTQQLTVHLNDSLNSNKHDWKLSFIVSQKVTRVTSSSLLQNELKMSASSTSARP